ncbi:NAD(P)H-dependent oxidoreductase [Mucilaginibacter sp. RS28]|uniref:NAD(P)H-dependent oxidoreductase n=1 Tax=Mucilaginibacter straminoryzae TaxID=2932774 RepID=A0A9X2BCR6_9SPHI|nr:NADPH-dependent FMN reductase [Mucilaginibacter straminoryzae]MCJ8211262.1 NAD(P)H-dependent oxidoreductase [Mucilaginibacter straminoryzae]
MERYTILGISGSLRQGAAHTAILEQLSALLEEPFKLLLCEGLEEIPAFNPEKDIDPAPASVAHFRDQLKSADALLICTPEYAYGIPGALKNAMDWVVSSGELVNKPVAVITASGLGEHAHQSIQLVLTAMNAKITEDTTLLISWIKGKLNEQNQISDPATLADAQKALQSLINTNLQ